MLLHEGACACVVTFLLTEPGSWSKFQSSLFSSLCYSHFFFLSFSSVQMHALTAVEDS